MVERWGSGVALVLGAIVSLGGGATGSAAETVPMSIGMNAASRPRAAAIVPASAPKRACGKSTAAEAPSIVDHEMEEELEGPLKIDFSSLKANPYPKNFFCCGRFLLDCECRDRGRWKVIR